MNWKIVFAITFFASVGLMIAYNRKPLVEYTVTSKERVFNLDKDGYPTGESFPVGSSEKTYHENYAAPGMVIGFGMIASASLLAIAIIIKKEKTYGDWA